ncbi:hypothetical protein DDP46_01365 [Helicobacter pylori]|nr:hypothetical protein [Helicobacter pylori]RKV15099.1 hypothetical protein DDP46_01365 [Helicobacter pylori]
MGFLILFFVSNSFFKGVGGYPITTPKLNPPNPKEALFKKLSLADESFLILILKMPLSVFRFLPYNELV